MVMELMCNGDLLAHLRKWDPSPANQRMIVHYATQVATEDEFRFHN